MAARPHLRTIDLPGRRGREVFRDELDPRALTIMAEVVRQIADAPGVDIPLPDMPGLSVAGRITGHCLTLELRGEGEPLQLIAVAAGDDECALDAWRTLSHDRPPAAPWCATLPAAAYDRMVPGDPVLSVMLRALAPVCAWAFIGLPL